jgi:pilus assembly protein CpaB
MRAVFGLVLLVGMGLAGFAVYMVNQYMDTQSAALERERERSANVVATIDIYSPARDMTYGEQLTIDDVKVIKYARDYLPEGVFQTEEELFPLGLNTPRVVTIPIRINEPILEAKVTVAGAPQGITALLDVGMRAFPLPDRMTEPFAGELRNSDRIDLYWVGSVGGGRDISRLVKSRLEIIAIEEPDENGNGGGRGVVVQVSQEDFADLNVLQSAGSLSLTPVGRDDLEDAGTTIETNIQDVLGIEEAVVVAPEIIQEERKCYVSQGFGVNAVQIEIECQN